LSSYLHPPIVPQDNINLKSLVGKSAGAVGKVVTKSIGVGGKVVTKSTGAVGKVVTLGTQQITKTLISIAESPEKRAMGDAQTLGNQAALFEATRQAENKRALLANGGALGFDSGLSITLSLAFTYRFVNSHRLHCLLVY